MAARTLMIQGIASHVGEIGAGDRAVSALLAPRPARGPVQSTEHVEQLFCDTGRQERNVLYRLMNCEVAVTELCSA